MNINSFYITQIHSSLLIIVGFLLEWKFSKNKYININTKKKKKYIVYKSFD